MQYIVVFVCICEGFLPVVFHDLKSTCDPHGRKVHGFLVTNLRLHLVTGELLKVYLTAEKTKCVRTWMASKFSKVHQ
jgi:hypothetical protein